MSGSDSPIEAFMRRFRVELTGVSWWRRRGITAEVRAHLEDVAAEERSRGLDQAESEHRAVARFGSPADVAAELRAEHRRPRWRVATAVAVVVIAALGGALLITRATSDASSSPTVVEVQVIPVQPRNAHWVVTAARHPQHDQIRYDSIAGLVPLHLPPTTSGPRESVPHQLVKLQLSDGRTIVYGPTVMPRDIQRLRTVLLNLYGQREEIARAQKLESQLIAQVTHNRPVHPVTSTPAITGGTPAQRRALARIVRQVPLPGTAEIRIQGTLLELIPPPGHGVIRDEQWAEVANGWGGNAIASAYDAIAPKRHLPALRTVRPDYQGQRAGAPIALTPPANPYSLSTLRQSIHRQARAEHLTIVRISLINLGGWNAYVEVRTPTPKHLSRLNIGIPNPGGAPGFSSTLTVIDNPCGTPISLRANYIWAGNNSGVVWQDRAWYVPLTTFMPGASEGVPATHIHPLSPSNPCF